MNPKSYVYKIVNRLTGEYYIGSRKCRNNKYDHIPTLDFGIIYKTSSKTVKDIGFDLFDLFDLVFLKADFKDHSDCYAYEQLLIHEHLNDELCLNQFCTIGKDGRIYKMNAYNRVVSEETKRKISAAKTGKKQTKKRVSVPCSPEKRAAISKSSMGKTRAHLPELNTPSHICPYCNRIFNIGNFKRYHGDKCKLNISKVEIV